MPEKLDAVRNAGLTSVPTMTSRTRTGISAASRTSETAAARRLRPCSTSSTSARLRSVTSAGDSAARAASPRQICLMLVAPARRSSVCRCRVPPPAASPSVAAISASRSNGGAPNSVNRSPRTRTTTRSQMSRSESSSLASSRPAPLCSVTAASSASSSAFDATSTPRVGAIATISRGLRAIERATVTFCWLPPDSSPTGWSRPADTIDRVRASGAIAADLARGRSQPSRRASQSTIDIVPFSATPSSATKPSAWRSSGM